MVRQKLILGGVVANYIYISLSDKLVGEGNFPLTIPQGLIFIKQFRKHREIGKSLLKARINKEEDKQLFTVFFAL